MLKAKRAVERALEEGDAVIDLPMVEDRTVLANDLTAAGMAVTFRSAEDLELKENFSNRVKMLRERLGKSQEEFARDYGLDKKTLQGWELGKTPDRGNRVLFRIIEADPITAKRLVDGHHRIS
ncbi:helix-turn-helix domain-containing protein [Paracoccus versutus]|uniref:helix-turn-helix domain-containing protein n=1 Tax=Paracoccus versutus TaxID=34007 RepID=UPI0015F0E3CA|nr:helix-turn-helix domain-containing protein [Paracoccus versutus]